MKKWIVIFGCLILVWGYGNASAENSSAGFDEANGAAEVQSLSQSMQNDQEIMNMITSLKNDPDFIKALDDPQLMKEINNTDIEALKNNPKFLKLMDNQTVKRIQEKVTEGNKNQ